MGKKDRNKKPKCKNGCYLENGEEKSVVKMQNHYATNCPNKKPNWMAIRDERQAEAAAAATAAALVRVNEEDDEEEEVNEGEEEVNESEEEEVNESEEEEVNEGEEEEVKNAALRKMPPRVRRAAVRSYEGKTPAEKKAKDFKGDSGVIVLGRSVCRKAAMKESSK